MSNMVSCLGDFELIMAFDTKLQGVSVARRIGDVLWSAVREEDSVGDGVPFRFHTRPSVHWKYNELDRLPFLGALPLHSLVDTRLCLYDTLGIQRTSFYSRKTTLLRTH